MKNKENNCQLIVLCAHYMIYFYVPMQSENALTKVFQSEREILAIKSANLQHVLPHIANYVYFTFYFTIVYFSIKVIENISLR